MPDKICCRAALVLSVLALVFLITNIALTVSVRNAQEKIAKRQPDIASAQQLSNLNQSLVRTMAALSIKSNDTQLRDLLSANGITLNVKAPATAEKK